MARLNTLQIAVLFRSYFKFIYFRSSPNKMVIKSRKKITKNNVLYGALT